MKQFSLSLLFVLFSILTLQAQQHLKWLHCMGSTDDDSYTNNVIARNGNIVSIGYTKGNNGDFAGNHGDFDVVITAMNDAGTVVWNKVVGGTASDGLNSSDLDTLTDGNIITAFGSASNNGDISGNHGQTDIVFRKYSPTGSLIWTKTIGGNQVELVRQVRATLDGGCIAIGSTTSNNSGDVGSNHNVGYADLWVVKLNAAGAIEWQKCYGGTNSDDAGAITLASGGGYYISGSTASTDGEMAGLVPAGTNLGGGDIWLAKINVTGTILWSRQIGGSQSEEAPVIVETGASVYVSFQSTSNDRDIPSNMGLRDIAVFKYSNAGVFIWKSMYSGFAWDSPHAIVSNNDGSVYVAAVSYSSTINGTTYYNASLDGQALIIKIDTFSSSIKSIRAYGGSARDFGPGLKIKPNGDFVVSGSTSSNDFEVYGNHGGYDAVVLQMAPANTISGIIFIDRNNNNIFNDGTDKRVSLVPVETGKQNGSKTVALSNNGVYRLDTDTGLYITRVKPYVPSYYTIVPDTIQTNFTAYYQTATRNIQLKPVVGIRDLRVYNIPLGQVRPAFKTRYLLIGYNVGTDTVLSGSLSWKKDSRVTVTNYSTPPSATYGDSVVWTFTNFRPFDSIRVYIDVTTPLPPQLNAGDTLQYLSKISPLTGDNHPIDNTLLLKNLVVGPLDPNEKVNLNGNKMLLAEVQAGSYVNYVVHFQNVGTASAFNVIINDTLSSKLQAGTLEPLAASHPYQMVVEGNVIRWRFNNINLPDSFSNEAGSHGFIAFRIKPLTTLLGNDLIVNQAAIYFDFNAPVITQPNVLKIVTEGALPIGLINFAAENKNGIVRCTWTTATELNVQSFIIQHSTNTTDFKDAGTVLPKGISGSGADYYFNHLAVVPGNNYYRLKSIDKDGSIAYSAQRLVTMSNADARIVCISKQGQLIVNIWNAEKGKAYLNVVGEDGKIIYKKETWLQKGMNTLYLPVNLMQGIYFVTCNVANKVLTTKILAE